MTHIETNEPSVNMHFTNANPNAASKLDFMSNMNPITSQYLIVPTHDNGGNSHSVISGNSGGTSRLNNYLWSESDDVTSEEGINVFAAINKEEGPFLPRIMSDIKGKLHQSSKGNNDNRKQSIQNHKTIFTNDIPN